MPRSVRQLLAVCGIALLLQSAIGTIAFGGIAAWSPVHSHIAFGAVPPHSHQYDRANGAAPAARCDVPHSDQHGWASQAAVVTCAPGTDATIGSVTTLLLSEQFGFAAAPAGVESAVSEAGEGGVRTHHDWPAPPPPRH